MKELIEELKEKDPECLAKIYLGVLEENEIEKLFKDEEFEAHELIRAIKDLDPLEVFITPRIRKLPEYKGDDELHKATRTIASHAIKQYLKEIWEVTGEQE